MGKWSDRLKLMNASTGLPAEPAEGASAGYGGVLGGASWASETPEGRSEPIEQLSLSRYATSGECRKVHSKVLSETIVLAADNAPLLDFSDSAVYRIAEIRLLAGLSPGNVRACHEAKVCFDGIIERSDPNETWINAADLLPAGEEADDGLAK